jgi:uncharacterized integral membrane protein
MPGSLITFIIVVIIIVIYVVSNVQPVEVKFLFWQAQVSKALLTLVPLMAGIILGFVLAQIDRFKKARTKARQKKQKKGG